MGVKNMDKAKKNKNDEFYTQYEDIEKELTHYKIFLGDKIIYCNCDDYRASKFYAYFKNNFNNLRLKKLIATCCIENGKGLKVEYDGTKEIAKFLESNGDFRSRECVEILKEADVIVTNPPFSLFRSFIDLIFYYKKDFIIIGNKNILSYNNVFPHIVNKEMFLGYKTMSGSLYMKREDDKVEPINCCWYTSFCIDRGRHLLLTKHYSPEVYSRYDNYDAINIDKTKDIPIDYFGKMGVPITFLDWYNPKDFVILNLIKRYVLLGEEEINRKIKSNKSVATNIKGVSKYARIIIQRIKED